MCLLCKKYNPSNLNPHNPITACLMFLGKSGSGGYTAMSRIPLQYELALVQDVEFQQDMFKDYVKSFWKIFVPSENVRNLYLWSNGTGLGKTFTASALLNEFNLYYVVNCWRNKEKPNRLPAFFLDLTELQKLYNSFNRPNVERTVANRASEEYYRRLNLSESCTMLCIDDLGTRDSTEGFRGDIHTLINHRVTSKMPIIYTSNFPIKDLEHVYEKRLYDRIRDNTVEINFDSVGESKRGL